MGTYVAEDLIETILREAYKVRYYQREPIRDLLVLLEVRTTCLTYRKTHKG